MSENLIPDGLNWRKSSYRQGGGMNNGDCVEVADGVAGMVPIHDSKKADHGPIILASAASFASFVSAVRSQGFDR
ncbi:DUF397 domain-containing protein [Streptomyces specialis]|uniref:DUF397 domain-containing protein n=1 Tax=Streptomyces specialis TaxID=498367 RepID=UPI00099F2696|nr:DUF397 domain-containing protein [Streptomyces specialis]